MVAPAHVQGHSSTAWLTSHSPVQWQSVIGVSWSRSQPWSVYPHPQNKWHLSIHVDDWWVDHDRLHVIVGKIQVYVWIVCSDVAAVRCLSPQHLGPKQSPSALLAHVGQRGLPRTVRYDKAAGCDMHQEENSCYCVMSIFLVYDYLSTPE